MEAFKSFFHVLLYQPLYNLLILFAWAVPGHSIGVAIIILTVIVRLILLPSSLKAAHAQVKNMELQPRINKIKSEIKDQKDQSAALMALYKEEGFSPFGSCLPLLIQLPILWVLFSVFRSGLTEEGFKDLYSFIPHPETMNQMFLGFNLSEPDKWILPIVAAVLQMGLSYLMMPRKDKNKKAEDEPKDPMAMMNKQMLFLPAVFTLFFGRSMPAALVIYWIVTTVFSIVQQLYVNKQILNNKKERAEARKELDSDPVVQEIDRELKAAEKHSLLGAPKKKKDWLAKINEKRLDKTEKKLGVNVTVRTKK
ncbi:MAG: YidC/Oxa1 family membrane protein insertase [Patescibacteria group bacterium]